MFVYEANFVLVCAVPRFTGKTAEIPEIPLLTFERVYFAKFHFHLSVFPRNTGLGTDIFIKLEYIAHSLEKIKSILDWHLFISRMETKWTKWYAMTSHVIAYRS